MAPQIGRLIAVLIVTAIPPSIYDSDLFPFGSRRKRMQVRWAMLVATLCLALPAAAKDWNPDEKAVWHLEEYYWHFVSVGDVESYVKLWHDDFVGWPCFE
jgi:hypothetical protein